MPCSAFSGGWRMRVALAGVLFRPARPVAASTKPTNYLDLRGRALAGKPTLARYPHSVLVISHDRGLLNRAVGHILHLEGAQPDALSGGYDAFARARAEARAVAIGRRQETGSCSAPTCRPSFDRVQGQGASKAKQAQSRVKMLEKMGADPRPQRMPRAPVFTFPGARPAVAAYPRAGRGRAWASDGKPVLSRLSLRIDQDDRIALLGRNGEGKSTLSKLLAGKLKALEGGCNRLLQAAGGLFRPAPGRRVAPGRNTAPAPAT